MGSLSSLQKSEFLKLIILIFHVSKIFDSSKKFAVPNTLLKLKNYCTWLAETLHSWFKGKLMSTMLHVIKSTDPIVSLTQLKE